MDIKIDNLPKNYKVESCFYGINKYRIDARGRLTVPPKFREIIDKECDGNLFVTMDLSGMSVCVYPAAFANEIYEKTKLLSSHENKVAKAVFEFVLPGEKCELDSQGRLLLPQVLRETAGVHVNTDVVLVGKGGRFDIWNIEQWQRQRMRWREEALAAAPEDFRTVLAKMGGLDL